MRAVIYSRYSTDKQTESSIADQVRVCTERAERDGHTVTQRFEDQGISGAAVGNRPGYQAMMTAGMASEFDILYVCDLTRLSRDTADLTAALKRMKFRNLRVIGVQDGFDNGNATARMQAGMSGIMSEEYRAQVGMRTHTALESRAKTGRATGGRCFGYTSKNEIAESEAPIVTEIFTRYANGESQHAIAKDLNRRGVPATKPGRPWYVSAVHALLHNERYLGRLVWNRTAWRKNPDTGKRAAFERPQSEWVVHTDEALRLVSDETWQRVRARDTPATYGSHNARPKYPLSGLLLCNECGKPMTLSGGTNARGYGSQRYVCSTFHNHGKDWLHGCENDLSVSRAVVEELLIGPLRDRLLDDPNFVAAVGALKDGKPRQVPSLPTPAPSPAALQAKLDAIQSAAAVGAMTARDAATRCAVLRAEHERATSASLPTDEASMMANAERLREALISAAVDALRAALRRTLGEVRCRPVRDDGPQYLAARFEGGDAALLAWLCVGDAANQSGLSALVAGARYNSICRRKCAAISCYRHHTRATDSRPWLAAAPHQLPAEKPYKRPGWQLGSPARRCRPGDP